MTSYLVEAYTAASSRIEDVEERVRRSVDELVVGGVPIRYVRSIFVPEDETCFHLLEGPSAEVVGTAVRAAGISTGRIVEAVPTRTR